MRVIVCWLCPRCWVCRSFVVLALLALLDLLFLNAAGPFGSVVPGHLQTTEDMKLSKVLADTREKKLWEALHQSSVRSRVFARSLVRSREFACVRVCLRVFACVRVCSRVFARVRENSHAFDPRANRFAI